MTVCSYGKTTASYLEKQKFGKLTCGFLRFFLVLQSLHLIVQFYSISINAAIFVIQYLRIKLPTCVLKVWDNNRMIPFDASYSLHTDVFLCEFCWLTKQEASDVLRTYTKAWSQLCDEMPLNSNRVTLYSTLGTRYLQFAVSV